MTLRYTIIDIVMEYQKSMFPSITVVKFTEQIGSLAENPEKSFGSRMNGSGCRAAGRQKLLTKRQRVHVYSDYGTDGLLGPSSMMVVYADPLSYGQALI